MSEDGENGAAQPEGQRDQDAGIRLIEALSDPEVARIARGLRETAGNESGPHRPSLLSLIALARALARACGAADVAGELGAELDGYEGSEVEIPEARRVNGFASAFPVRALELGLLEPEEIFSAGNEKFSQVTVTIAQPVAELEQALVRLRSGGVLALKVPASEVTNRSAETEPGTEVYIYILPREIQRIVDRARDRVVEVLVERIVEAAAASAEPGSATAG